jgi:hypothetical protein
MARILRICTAETRIRGPEVAIFGINGKLRCYRIPHPGADLIRKYRVVFTRGNRANTRHGYVTYLNPGKSEAGAYVRGKWTSILEIIVAIYQKCKTGYVTDSIVPLTPGSLKSESFGMAKPILPPTYGPSAHSAMEENASRAAQPAMVTNIFFILIS